MYTYPEALDAFQKVATDLLTEAGWTNFEVEVQPSTADTASVDWKRHQYWDYARQGYVNTMRVTIYMPVRKASSRMTEAEFQRWIAYDFHEIGHPLETDRIVWDQAVATKRHRLLNALEDVRMEKRIIARNIARNGQQSLESLIDGLLAESAASKFNPNEPRNIGWVMAVMGRKVCNGYDIDVTSITAKLDPAGPVAKVLQWALPALGACQSTQDCLDLADRITAALPAKLPEPQRSEEHTSELQSLRHLVCRLLLEKKKI